MLTEGYEPAPSQVGITYCELVEELRKPNSNLVGYVAQRLSATLSEAETAELEIKIKAITSSFNIKMKGCNTPGFVPDTAIGYRTHLYFHL